MARGRSLQRVGICTAERRGSHCLYFSCWSSFAFEHQIVSFTVLLSGKNRQTRKNSQGECTGRGRCEKGQKWMLLYVTSALTEPPWFSLSELHLIWKQPYGEGLYCAFSTNTFYQWQSDIKWFLLVFPPSLPCLTSQPALVGLQPGGSACATALLSLQALSSLHQMDFKRKENLFMWLNTPPHTFFFLNWSL